MLGITLGTGIGFGIIINGKLFNGSYGMAGEYEFSPLNNNLTWAELIGYRFFKEITNKNFLSAFNTNNNVTENINNNLNKLMTDYKYFRLNY